MDRQWSVNAAFFKIFKKTCLFEFLLNLQIEEGHTSELSVHVYDLANNEFPSTIVRLMSLTATTDTGDAGVPTLTLDGLRHRTRNARAGSAAHIDIFEFLLTFPLFRVMLQVKIETVVIWCWA
jgi:hypothetical protein